MNMVAAVKPSKLDDVLLSQGVTTFNTSDAIRRTGLPRDRVHLGLKRLADAGRIFSPARGFYVIVPAEFRSWRTVPAMRFIDQMMSHLGRTYYVGLLSAAELHGAAHQRPQKFQTIIDKYLPDRSFGRVRMHFVVNRHTADLPIVHVNSPTAAVRVSTPEVTALDLANHPLHSGGLGNVATVLTELFEDRKIAETDLVDAARHYPSAVVRRTGYLLEHYADVRLDQLHAFVRPAGHEPAPLDASGPRTGPVDRRWTLRHNTEIDPDL